MKNLRHLIAVAALAALSFAFAVSASAQQYVTYSGLATTTLNGGTNNLAATTTNAASAVWIDVPRSEYVAVQPSFKLTGAGTSAVTFVFKRSMDRTNVEATAIGQITVSANGTTTVTGSTNFTMGAYGYLQVSSVGNANATALTNIALYYSFKR